MYQTQEIRATALKLALMRADSIASNWNNEMGLEGIEVLANKFARYIELGESFTDEEITG